MEGITKDMQQDGAAVPMNESNVAKSVSAPNTVACSTSTSNRDDRPQWEDGDLNKSTKKKDLKIVTTNGNVISCGKYYFLCVKMIIALICALGRNKKL